MAQFNQQSQDLVFDLLATLKRAKPSKHAQTPSQIATQLSTALESSWAPETLQNKLKEASSRIEAKTKAAEQQEIMDSFLKSLDDAAGVGKSLRTEAAGQHDRACTATTAGECAANTRKRKRDLCDDLDRKMEELDGIRKKLRAGFALDREDEEASPVHDDWAFLTSQTNEEAQRRSTSPRASTVARNFSAFREQSLVSETQAVQPQSQVQSQFGHSPTSPSPEPSSMRSPSPHTRSVEYRLDSSQAPTSGFETQATQPQLLPLFQHQAITATTSPSPTSSDGILLPPPSRVLDEEDFSPPNTSEPLEHLHQKTTEEQGPNDTDDEDDGSSSSETEESVEEQRKGKGNGRAREPSTSPFSTAPYISKATARRIAPFARRLQMLLLKSRMDSLREKTPPPLPSQLPQQLTNRLIDDMERRRVMAGADGMRTARWDARSSTLHGSDSQSQGEKLSLAERLARVRAYSSGSGLENCEQTREVGR